VYLLDTNVVSELRKPRPNQAVLNWLQSVPDADLFLPAVVLGELQRGVEQLRARDPEKAALVEQWVDQLASSSEVVSMDARVVRQWARLVERHPGPLVVDAMIAATAAVHGLTVVSRNVRDFERLGATVLNPFSSGH
jgi:toxin FitB